MQIGCHAQELESRSSPSSTEDAEEEGQRADVSLGSQAEVDLEQRLRELYPSEEEI